MRLKFFLTILSVLIATAISISAIHFHFFKLERLRLIELNLQQNATLILDSDLNLTKKEFLQKGEEYIHEIIGNDKVNMIVSIYQDNGTLLYQNDNALIFGTPRTLKKNYKEWEDVETKDYLIKYLTTEDKDQHRVIKVGMILNQSLLRWKYLSQRVIIFAAIILGIVIMLSYFLTSLLFRPIHTLAGHVNAMAEKLEAGDTDDFKSILHMSSNRFSDDEFSALLKSIHKLALKITETHNITKKWSAMMAHELKTPLTILKNRVESLAMDESTNKQKIADVDEEMSRMERIIEDFLEWASLENDPAKPEIHAISVNKRCLYIIENFRMAFPSSNILYSASSVDMKIFCNPIHFDQMLTNLISNSLKYGEGEVLINCEDGYLLVADKGPGIPEDVLGKLGSPFNHSRINGVKGFGLGLAWVNTICRKYDWNLKIENKNGNSVQIFFSNL